MSVEIGKVIEGTVTGITNFGAFIELPDGKTGLCHISEVSNDYVKDVKDFLKENQKVKVKVTKVDDKGKISLSIRQAVEGAEKPERPRPVRKEGFNRKPSQGNYNSSNNSRGSYGNSNNSRGSHSGSNSRGNSSGSSSRSNSSGSSSRGSYNNSNYNSRRTVKPAEDFESMLNSFIKTSDDKLKSVKKAKSNRKGNGFNNKK